MDDAARVAALLSRDPQGLADTYDTYGSALYAFCHSMLRDRHEAEDAVQDTFIVLAERVGQLRDANRLRPWLYAVARSECLRRIRSTRRTTPVAEVDDVIDESADLAEGLRTTDLQRLVWQAIEGLNTGERAALELSLRHGLDGDDLAAALGVSRANATKLMQRARGEFDRSLGALLVARSPDGTCSALGQIVDGWDGQLNPLMRKRLSRHIDSCRVCGAQRERRVNASALLATIPLLAAPVGLRAAIVHRTGMVSYDRSIARRAGVFDRAGFPDERGPSRRAGAAAATLAACVALVLIAIVLPSRDHHAHARALVFGPSPSSTSPRASSGSPTTPASSSPTSSTTASSGSPTPASSSLTSAPHGTSSGRPPVSKTNSSGPPPKVTLTVSPTSLKFPYASGGTAQLELNASGGDVTWTATDKSGLLKLSAYGGSLRVGGKFTVSVTAPAEKQFASDTVVFSWASKSLTVTVAWS